MPETKSQKYSSSKSAFPDQSTGAVVGCPKKGGETAGSSAPVEFEKTFRMTQEILQTMSGARSEQKSKEKKAWIEIILVDSDGKPMPGVRYRITPPGGQPVEGRLNEHGQAGVYNIEPGNCKVTFPDLDKDAWE